MDTRCRLRDFGELLPDSRLEASEAQIAAWVDTQHRIAGVLTEVLFALDGARKARTQIEALQSEYDEESLQSLGVGEFRRPCQKSDVRN